jgi:hypothetical protein
MQNENIAAQRWRWARHTRACSNASIVMAAAPVVA